MLRIILFDLLLLGACGYALWRGQRDERLVAVVCIAANFLSFAFLTQEYAGVEVGVLAVDILALTAFTYVALRTHRFWPLWVSGLQLTTSVGHLLKAMMPDLLPLAYAAALRFWSYPILIILLVATYRCQQYGEPPPRTA